MPRRNAVLRSLGRDLDELKPHLQPIILPRGKRLAEPEELVSRVYFPVRGIVSCRVVLEAGHEIELVPTGHNSAVGIFASVGFMRSLTRDVCLTETQGWVVRVSEFQALLKRSPQARHAIENFCHAQMKYAVRAATCNAMHTAEQRLARWLLLATELVGRDGVRLSQDDLADVIGVGRSFLNPLLQRLRRSGLIDVGRQRFEVLDAAQLRLRACECLQILHDAMPIGSSEAAPSAAATLA